MPNRIAQDVRSGLRNAFTETFRRAGYESSRRRADVLGLSVRVFDLYINAPKTVTQALPSRVYTHDAGVATLAFEVLFHNRACWGESRPPHGRLSGGPSIRITDDRFGTSSIRKMFDVWRRSCIDELKTQSPVAVNVPAQNKY